MSEDNEVKKDGSYYEPRTIFHALVTLLGVDNGVQFSPTEDQVKRAEPHIKDLFDKGYLLDSVLEDGTSYDMLIRSPHEPEAHEFFSKAPIAYKELSDILEEVFDNCVDSEATEYMYGRRAAYSNVMSDMESIVGKSYNTYVDMIEANTNLSESYKRGAIDGIKFAFDRL